MKIGIEVVTGFLGAGKTAFINSLIDKTLVEGERVVVLSMENGNTTIREIKNENNFVKNISLNNSDIKLHDEIERAVIKYKPHRIIVEYNGTENLEVLYKAIFSNKVSKLCSLFTPYFICDGKNIQFYIKNMGEILLPFIENSEVIVINNCNNVIENKLTGIKKELGEINGKAHILNSNDNLGFKEALINSKLLESEFMRKVRVKVINYKNKW